MYLLKFISKIREITSENLFLDDLSNYEPLCYAAYIGSSIIQLQDGWVTFGGTTEIFSTKTRGEVQEEEKSRLLYCHWTHISRFLAA